MDLQDVGIMNATIELFFFAPLCQVDYCRAKPVEKVEKRKVCRYKYIYCNIYIYMYIYDYVCACFQNEGGLPKSPMSPFHGLNEGKRGK